MMHALAAVAITATVSACHHHPGTSLSAACEAVPLQNPRDMRLADLPGMYAVTFVATAGPRAGQTASGRLVLRPQDSGLLTVGHADTTRVVEQPTIGQLDLAMEDVGATRMGDPMAEADTMPGVGFYVTRLRNGAVQGVVARVGSASNTRGQMLFDGGYFALYVREVESDRISGGWASAPGGMGREATGHFCARRIGA
jgi:hypothetical protein